MNNSQLFYKKRQKNRINFNTKVFFEKILSLSLFILIQTYLFFAIKILDIYLLINNFTLKNISFI
jgi:hypothetical protein